MSNRSLKLEGNPLADPLHQLAILEPVDMCEVPRFEDRLAEHGLPPIHSTGIEILQINVGKLCNQVCQHCHVDAGPDRRENMTRETFEACLDLLKKTDIKTVDLTGGAPEMNPNFEWFVTEVRTLGRHVIDRSNLTILTAQGFTHLPKFLADNQVEVVASLPCYMEENCDSQRGDGVFQKSIKGLQLLNELGYAMPDSDLELSLVYNPVGPSLPPDQQKLEADYRDQLRSRFEIEFNRLYTITNMPISRFLDDLLKSGQYEEYMQKLVQSFNPQSVERLMCRDTLSIDYLGNLYDCDFNQMLELGVDSALPQNIHEFDIEAFQKRKIITGRHCYGCTAGAGSSCQGSLIS